MSRIRVLIAEDHAVVREGLRLILASQPDMEVVGEAGDGAEALAQAARLRPDIVLMDITMPGLSGLEATRRLKARHPGVGVLVLTMHEGEEYLFQLLHAGASGYLLKESASDELLAAIRAVHRGGVYLHPTMAAKLMADFLKHPERARLYGGLTPREREVLKLLAAGHTYQEVGAALGISVNTVQAHRANIMAKLDLHDRTELITYAVRKGLIRPEG